MTFLWKFYVIFVPERHFCGVSQIGKHLQFDLKIANVRSQTDLRASLLNEIILGVVFLNLSLWMTPNFGNLFIKLQMLPDLRLQKCNDKHGKTFLPPSLSN
jgi:hypothetical protein